MQPIITFYLFEQALEYVEAYPDRNYWIDEMFGKYFVYDMEAQ